MTASSPMAIGYHPYTRSLPKNDKLAMLNKVYGVDAAHNNSVSNPKKAKQLAFSLRVSS
ncbi:MAG: hypothetical protein WBG65_04225 [Sulfurimonadaceae bacterium]